MGDTRKDYGPTGCVNRSFMLLALCGLLMQLIRRGRR